MNLLELMKKRYSVRSYEERTVEKEKLDKILEAAHIAPSAANLQPVRLIVIQNKERLKALSMAAKIYDAPLAILICTDRKKVWERPFDGNTTTDIDASIVTDHMMLEATELGLGSVWICRFKPDIVKREFHLPENWEPVNILAIGYGKGKPADPGRHHTQRVPLEEIVLYEDFQ